MVPVRVVKEFRFTEGSDEITVCYRISADSDDSVQVNFAIENNLNLQDGHSDTKYLEIDENPPARFVPGYHGRIQQQIFVGAQG